MKHVVLTTSYDGCVRVHLFHLPEVVDASNLDRSLHREAPTILVAGTTPETPDTHAGEPPDTIQAMALAAAITGAQQQFANALRTLKMHDS
jgi:hypothetical protein